MVAHFGYDRFAPLAPYWRPSSQIIWDRPSPQIGKPALVQMLEAQAHFAVASSQTLTRHSYVVELVGPTVVVNPTQTSPPPQSESSVHSLPGEVTLLVQRWLLHFAANSSPAFTSTLPSSAVSA